MSRFVWPGFCHHHNMSITVDYPDVVLVHIPRRIHRV